MDMGGCGAGKEELGGGGAEEVWAEGSGVRVYALFVRDIKRIRLKRLKLPMT